ncbi:unnamed protein product [Angiostrongylus costaricensis]|uniref:CNH domain-containing protein n=1 Tax=Angiostrongylus costaricensis TaxID=334426 RepID=A0A3P7HZK3_ANGCS|nr:unnamed protein product [Angiostrongylus costaricensis]
MTSISNELDAVITRCLRYAGIENSVRIIEIPPSNLTSQLVGNSLYYRLCTTQNCIICSHGREGDSDSMGSDTVYLICAPIILIHHFDVGPNNLQMFSALYELTPVGQWTELQYRISESYLDMLAFAVVGPITQILVVEGKLGYALQFSVRESEVVDRRRLAICERPGAITRDEAGRLFIVNRASTSIQLVDTVRWAPARNVALTDNLVPHFSASWGLLAVALKGAIRLQRYSFRLGYK